MHERFHYKTFEELKQELEKLGLRLPLSDSIECLFQPLEQNGIVLNNRIAIQPMEGCDGTLDGSPGELTKRRYDRFARSGAGLIWAEAVAIVPEGRAKPFQLHITEQNLDQFRHMVDQIKETSLKVHGFAPKIIMQAAHSGRYSNPRGYSEPIIAYNNPVFEKNTPIDPSRIITDSELQRLEERYGWAAAMAEKAGFDGIDIKCCHRYLLCEFLSAFTREGAYGGSFENRTRLLRNSIQAAQASVSGDFIVTTRLNVYDGFPYPYGFGVNETDGLKPDLREPVMLVKQLREELGLKMLNVSVGNPYVNPHVNRPYDRGNYVPDEHPLVGVARLMDCVKEIQESQKDLLVIGSGFSYPRQYAASLAAGMVENECCGVVGFGRMAFAYPDFFVDLQKDGALNEKKCCISCGECAKLLRAGENAGCVVRDSVFYKPYKG